MATQYSLIVVNNSTNFQNFCVYQTPPDLGNANDVTVASLVDSGEPGATVTFEWDAPSGADANDLAKYWVAAGDFEPGQVLDPDEMTNAAEVVYQPGSDAMRATLNPDNSWMVTEG